MAQFARPDSDVTVTNITGVTVDTAGNRYQNVDESSANDADYNYGANNTVATYEAGLSNVTDPASSSNHVVRYRIAKTNAGTVDGGGNALTVTASLYQGTTLIAADAAQTPTGTWTGYSFTLSGAQADAITDYTDLRLRFVTTASGGSPANRRGGAVSWGELEVPDAPTFADTAVALPIAVTQSETIEAYGESAVSTPIAITQVLSTQADAETAVALPIAITQSEVIEAYGESAIVLPLSIEITQTIEDAGDGTEDTTMSLPIAFTQTIAAEAYGEAGVAMPIVVTEAVSAEAYGEAAIDLPIAITQSEGIEAYGESVISALIAVNIDNEIEAFGESGMTHPIAITILQSSEADANSAISIPISVTLQNIIEAYGEISTSFPVSLQMQAAIEDAEGGGHTDTALQFTITVASQIDIDAFGESTLSIPVSLLLSITAQTITRIAPVIRTDLISVQIADFDNTTKRFDLKQRKARPIRFTDRSAITKRTTFAEFIAYSEKNKTIKKYM